MFCGQMRSGLATGSNLGRWISGPGLIFSLLFNMLCNMKKTVPPLFLSLCWPPKLELDAAEDHEWARTTAGSSCALALVLLSQDCVMWVWAQWGWWAGPGALRPAAGDWKQMGLRSTSWSAEILFFYYFLSNWLRFSCSGCFLSQTWFNLTLYFCSLCLVTVFLITLKTSSGPPSSFLSTC